MSGPKPRRSPDAPTVLVALDPSDRRPLHRQIYDGLRSAILSGRLAPGARIPATRTLAMELGVARNTVVLAFDQLAAEGYLTGRRGGGSRVRDAIPDALLGVPGAGRHSAAPQPSRALKSRPAAPRLPAISASGAMLAAEHPSRSRGDTPPVPFELGVPALDAFPIQLWTRLAARRWRRGGTWLGSGDPAGEPELRAAISAYVSNSRGARCTADEVLVVSGVQQALDLVARVLVERGDAVWVENPGYTVGHAPFAAAGARITPVPVDADGLDVAAGERLAPDARLAYVTPSHQFPLGVVMSASRRLALLAWARRGGAWIVEDDYDSEFRYAGRPLPCLQGLDAERRAAGDLGRVLYVGTFSKTLVPGLRFGYLVVPDALVDVFRAARAALDRHPPMLEQGVLADFITEGHFARHVRRMRALYAERQQSLLDAAESTLEGLVTLEPDPAGLHLLGWLPPGVDDAAASRAALSHGVEATPLSRFTLAHPGGTSRGALLLSYAGYDERAIRAAVHRLRRALE